VSHLFEKTYQLSIKGNWLFVLFWEKNRKDNYLVILYPELAKCDARVETSLS
jgi:hypothetical protein